jgi:hypothetical protein
MEHHVSQIQPDFMIFNAPKCEMKTPFFTMYFYLLKTPMFSFLIQVPLKSSNQAASDLCDASYHKLSGYVQNLCLSIILKSSFFKPLTWGSYEAILTTDDGRNISHLF